MATFIRPVAPTCGGFAAMGPQLQALAEAVDSDLQILSTSEIFKALDAPFISLLKTSSDFVDASPFFNPISFDIGYAIVEATNNGGITQATLTPGFLPDAVVFPATSQPRWYYIGAYLQSPVNPIDTRWKVNLTVTDVDSVTGVTNFQQFFREYTCPGLVGTGNEYIWVDFLVSSRGGAAGISAAINTGATQTVNGGRFWAMQIAPRK